MFDIAPSELIIVSLVAIVFIGPKDLPRVLRVAGHWVGKGRAMTRRVYDAIDEIIREAEVHESAKKWSAENARIMAEHASDTREVNPDDAMPVRVTLPMERPTRAGPEEQSA